MSEEEIDDDAAEEGEADADDEDDDEDGENPYEVLERTLGEIDDNLKRVKKTAKALVAAGDEKSARALLEISGTVLPLAAEVTQAVMDLDDVNDDRVDELERRIAAIESTLMPPEEATNHIGALGELRAFIDNMIAGMIAGGEMDAEKEQVIARLRRMADGVSRTQYYLERFLPPPTAEGADDGDTDPN